MNSQQTFLIINQGNVDYCLAIRGDKVVIALSNPLDPYQIWIRKDTGSRDQEGQPIFTLVNKGTNEAIWHNGTTGPLSLVPNNASFQDNSTFWSESRNADNGFTYIRRANVISIHITANSHQIHDGRIVDLSSAIHPTERWKFIPYSDVQQATTKNNVQTVTISCRRKAGYNLTVRNDAVMLAPADSRDKNQMWIKDTSYGNLVKDDDGRRSFALINRATGKAIKHGFGGGYLVQLAPFNQNYLDSSLLWTENLNEAGFQEIRVQSNRVVVLHAFYVDEADSNRALLALRARNNTIDQRWKFELGEIILWDGGDASKTNDNAKSDNNYVNSGSPAGEGAWVGGGL